MTKGSLTLKALVCNFPVPNYPWEISWRGQPISCLLDRTVSKRYDTITKNGQETHMFKSINELIPTQVVAKEA